MVIILRQTGSLSPALASFALWRPAGYERHAPLSRSRADLCAVSRPVTRRTSGGFGIQFGTRYANSSSTKPIRAHAWRDVAANKGAGAKSWLKGSGIALLPATLARTPEEARRAADLIGYPVVAKLSSAQVAHKSEVDGVRVGLADGAAVPAAWEAIHASAAKLRPDAVIDGVLIEKMAPAGGVETLIGVHRDPVFGHILTFGLGGIFVELFKDVTRRLLPLTPRDAAAMIREVRCFALLDGARGRPPCDLPALEKLLLAVSDFVAAHVESIEEMDLNPVWVGPRGQGALPLDAMIVRRD